MKDRVLLVVGIGSLFALSAVQDPIVLASALALVLLLSGSRARTVLRRAIRAVVWFTLTMVAGVVVMGLMEGRVDTGWILRTVLRVLAMTSTTFLVMERVDVARAIAPWPALASLLTIAGAQIRLLQREVDDLKLGLRSRSLRRPGTRTLARHAASGGAQFLGRALHDAEEISLAMQARGAWHVRGE